MVFKDPSTPIKVCESEKTRPHFSNPTNLEKIEKPRNTLQDRYKLFQVVAQQELKYEKTKPELPKSKDKPKTAQTQKLQHTKFSFLRHSLKT